MNTDLWRLGHDHAEMRFPSLGLLRTFVMFREQFLAWPWKETHVVDVGACVGSFSLAAAMAWPDVDLNVVEPWPEALVALEDNLRRCRVRCNLHKLAASDVAEIRLMAEGAKWGMSSLHGIGPGVMVRTVTLDSLLKGPVSLMKLDVEGHELAVLRGAAGLLAQYHPRLILEVRADQQAKAGHTPNDVTDYLHGLGYIYSVQMTKQDFLYSTEKAVYQ